MAIDESISFELHPTILVTSIGLTYHFSECASSPLILSFPVIMSQLRNTQQCNLVLGDLLYVSNAMMSHLFDVSNCVRLSPWQLLVLAA